MRIQFQLSKPRRIYIGVAIKLKVLGLPMAIVNDRYQPLHFWDWSLYLLFVRLFIYKMKP